MITGDEPVDSGIIRMGPAIRAAYLPQIIHFEHPERSLLDTMLYEKKGMTPQTARNRLAAYQFQGRTCSKACRSSPAASSAACGCACSWTRRSTS